MKQPQKNTRDIPKEKEELVAKTKKMKEKILRKIIQLKNIDIENSQKLCKIRSDKKTSKINKQSKKSYKK